MINRRLPGDYVKRPEELEILPGVSGALARLKAAGLFTVLVSNQRGVGRGIMTLESVEAVHRHLQTALAAHGAALDAIYFCPDLEGPDRKPAPGMLLRARQDHPSIDPATSVMVGDSPSDMRAGAAFGCRNVLVGVMADEAGRECAAAGIPIHHRAADLPAAVEEYILAARSGALF